MCRPSRNISDAGRRLQYIRILAARPPCALIQKAASTDAKESNMRCFCESIYEILLKIPHGGGNIIVLFKAGGLRFDKIKGLAETFLRCAQCPPTGEKNDAGHKKHADDQMEPPSPCIREGSVFMRQGCPPPDTAKHAQDIGQGSAPVCRLCASAQEQRLAGCPAHGCHFLQRRCPGR